MIRVLLAEDQAMVRGALVALLSLEKDIEIVAEAARGAEVVAAPLDAQPDVALLDIEMQALNALDAAPAGGDRTQLSLGGDSKADRANPGRGGAHRGAARLAHLGHPALSAGKRPRRRPSP